MTTPRLAPLALATFAANLGLSIIFPLIPHLARTSGAGPAAVGWIFSSYAVMLVIAQVAGGVLADRLDTKKLLVAALWGYFLTLLGFCVSRDIAPLMANRALEGAMIGLVIPAVMTLVVRQVPPERLGRGIGFVMGLGGLGFIAGPVLGAALAHWSLALPFLVAALVAALAAIGVTKFLEPTPAAAPTPAWGPVVRHELGALGKLIAAPAFLALVLPLMAVKINFSTLQAGIPLYGEAYLGIGMGEVGALFVVTALAYGVVQPLAGRLADRMATATLLPLALVALACSLAAMALPRGFWPFLAVWTVFSCAQSAGVLFSMKHLGDALGEGATGRSFGLAAAIGDTGMIAAPSLIMALYAWRPEALFGALAAVMLAVVALVPWLGRWGRKPRPAEA